MVVDVTADRVAAAPSHAARMKSRSDSELNAFCPNRIIIIQTIEREVIDPEAETSGLRRPLLDDRQRPPDVAGHHHYLHPELFDHEIELDDRFVRRMHWDYGDGR